MPNYCNNKVTLVGHAEDLDVFEAERLAFSKFVPQPEDQKDNWFEWNNANWGTKWEHWDYSVVLRDECVLVVEFRTAWSPPLDFFKGLLASYGRCWIKCEFNTEDCMAGVWVGYMKGGVCVDKEFVWEEPMPYLTVDGTIHIPEEDDSATTSYSAYRMRGCEDMIVRPFLHARI